MVSASRPERTRPASAVMESRRALRSAADVTCERALFSVLTMSTILLSLTCSGNMPLVMSVRIAQQACNRKNVSLMSAK